MTVSGPALRTVVVGIVMLAACFDAKLPEKPPSGDTTSDASLPSGDAGSASGDAGSAGGDASSPDQASELPRHMRCEMALRPELTAEIDTSSLRLDAARQNAWADVDCTELPPLARCSPDQLCPDSSGCVHLSPGALGYCEIFGDGRAVPTDYAGGECVQLFKPEMRAALCCEGSGDVDCASWPPTVLKAPGEICTDHSHCEVGLVCVPLPHDPEEGGYGRCACPEAAHYQIADAGWCWGFYLVPDWGKPALKLPVGGCAPAIAEGYVQEVLLEVTPTHLQRSFAFKQDAAGYLYALDAEPDGLHILTDRAIDWPGLEALGSAFELSHWVLPWAVIGFVPAEEILEPDDRVPELSLDLAADGTPHIAYVQDRAVFVVHPVGDAWAQSAFDTVDYAGTWRLHLTAEGRRMVATSGTVATEGDDGWRITPLLLGATPRNVVSWPGTAVRILTGGGFIDLPSVAEPWNQVITPREEVPYSPLITGGDLLALFARDRTLFLDTMTADGGLVSSAVWSYQGPLDDPYFGIEVKVEDSSLALDANGEVLVVHRAPEGLSLTRRGPADEWQTNVLIADRASPFATTDRAGKLQVFLTVDGDWDGQREQLRRVRQGACN
jgi:hypothetical protein